MNRLNEIIRQLEIRWREEHGILDDISIWFDDRNEEWEQLCVREDFDVPNLRKEMMDYMFKVPKK